MHKHMRVNDIKDRGNDTSLNCIIRAYDIQTRQFSRLVVEIDRHMYKNM